MHIPASMLNGPVCPVTLAIGAAGITAAVFTARKSEEKPSPAGFAAVTALIFALQMLNYPVQNGTSGHLVGAMLAVVSVCDCRCSGLLHRGCRLWGGCARPGHARHAFSARPDRHWRSAFDSRGRHDAAQRGKALGLA